MGPARTPSRQRAHTTRQSTALCPSRSRCGHETRCKAGDPDAARPTPAARLAALAPRRLPSRATVAAPTCRESSAAALSRTDAGARCDAGAIPMPRDPPRRGSTLGSRRPAEAALACHGRGSDVQQRKLGGGSCLLVAFLFVIQVHTRHQTVNCTVKRMHRSVGGPVTGRYRPIFAAVTGEARNAAGGPASIQPVRSESASVVRYPQTDERSSVAERATAPCWNLPIDTPEVSRTAPVTPSRACDHSAPMAYPRPPPRCSPHAPRSRSARRNARNRPAGRVPASADRDGSRRIRKAPETVV